MFRWPDGVLFPRRGAVLVAQRWLMESIHYSRLIWAVEQGRPLIGEPWEEGVARDGPRNRERAWRRCRLLEAEVGRRCMHTLRGGVFHL